MASWDGGIDGGNATWTISREGDAGYGRATFLSSIDECGVCCDGVKLDEGARRDSYLFLRIPKIWLRMHEDTQKPKKKFYEDFCTRPTTCRQIDKLSI